MEVIMNLIGYFKKGIVLYCIYQSLLGALAEEWVVPHLPGDTEHFSVEIVVDNLLVQERTIKIDAFGAGGTDLGHFTVEVPPLSRQAFDPAAQVL